ncbi:hypothetical protein SCLCIDRAFT_287163 [Scleroderma citrinum Foug A]|uniref:Uncharacterized protein n=1 Tax=Scleroderma citrinum Foug A TaxID=1036808 RepID=A0A0C2Z1Q4_9AGAM|nr:hypothetical protein SCLCIDRAFT_287163 [Scleroderma citrinum Foug A]
MSVIMKKCSDKRDVDCRRNYVATLQAGQDSRVDTAAQASPHKRYLADQSHLIIAPASVVQNLKREFQIWGYFQCDMLPAPTPHTEATWTPGSICTLGYFLTQTHRLFGSISFTVREWEWE